MELTVTGKHIEITDPIRTYAADKTSKLPRFFDRIMAIEVVADKETEHTLEVEIIVSVEHHDPFVAKTGGTDLYACIDEAISKMERQLRDHKEKLRQPQTQRFLTAAGGPFQAQVEAALSKASY